MTKDTYCHLFQDVDSFAQENIPATTYNVLACQGANGSAISSYKAMEGASKSKSVAAFFHFFTNILTVAVLGLLCQHRLGLEFR